MEYLYDIMIANNVYVFTIKTLLKSFLSGLVNIRYALEKHNDIKTDIKVPL